MQTTRPRRPRFLHGLGLLALLAGLAGLWSGKLLAAAEESEIREAPSELPVTVHVGVYYTDFDSVDVAAQNFKAMGYLEYHWKDSRLAFDAAKEGLKEKYFTKEEIWHPFIEVVNAQENDISMEDEFKVTPDGTVSYNGRFVSVLDTEFDVRDFPFDTQKLDMRVESFKYDAKVVRLVADEKETGISKQAFLAEWSLRKIITHTELNWLPPEQTDYSSLVFSLEAQRNRGYYFWKMVMPLALTVIISWITFWVDVGDLQTQLGVSITLVLTMVAFSITLDFSLPKVSYLTWMDKFQFLCFAMVFLVAMENVIIKNIETTREELARKIRRQSRWIFPLIFVVVNSLLFA